MPDMLPPCTPRRRARSVNRTLLRVAVGACALLLVTVAVASAHDMFLRPDRHLVAENAEVLVRVLNGTFSTSENSLTRDRVQDISVVGPDGRARLDTTAWTTAGDTSTFRVRTGAAGTYALGASTRSKMIELKASDFNRYLREDGIPDVLAARRRDGELAKPARERYSKHVKALLQVGTTRSDAFATVLGYPAELVPLDNPYALRVGATLRLRTLVDGKAAPNQYVIYGGRTAAGARIAQRGTRSDAQGIVGIPLRGRGVWFVKFINMARVEGDAEADYESKWATITYEVR